jgi:hypothetical protein
MNRILRFSFLFLLFIISSKDIFAQITMREDTITITSGNKTILKPNLNADLYSHYQWSPYFVVHMLSLWR